MNLSHLRYFVELAHVQHYTRTAERLCITQPSLSHAISQLEGELGVPLFEKNGRSISLTQYGEQFLACAQETLSIADVGGRLCAQIGSSIPGREPRKGHSIHLSHRCDQPSFG